MTIHATYTLRCGDAWTFNATLTDNNGNPVNLTGAAITWKLDSLNLLTNYLTLTNGFGVTITNAVAGTVTYGPSKAQTTGLTPNSYYDTLQVIFPDGVTAYTYIEGTINAVPKPV